MHSNLSFAPSAFGDPSYRLNQAHNRLTGQLPNTVSFLGNLTTLDLSDNVGAVHAKYLTERIYLTALFASCPSMKPDLNE